jgi:hypothetical protein
VGRGQAVGPHVLGVVNGDGLSGGHGVPFVGWLSWR